MAQDAYTAYHAAVDQFKVDLARLAELDLEMDFPSWSDQATMQRQAHELRQLCDQVFKQGEFAAYDRKP